MTMQRIATLDGVCVRPIAAALAASLLAGLAFVSLAQAQTQQAGVTAAVRGRVELAAVPGEVGRLVRSGEPVYLGNAVKSGPDSGLQILLLDQTTFTIGPDSEITIDRFIYDPQSGAGKVSASVAKGVFRFVTGRVAQNNPSDMEVKLPVGIIGIRGTIALGSVDDGKGNGANGANGNVSAQVVLVGPGKDLEGNNRPGGLNLAANGGASQNITQPGFGSVFGAGGWGTPQFFTPQMMGALTTRLTSFTNQGQGGQQGQQGQQGQGQNQGQGGQATKNAGAGNIQGQGNANSLAGLNNVNRLNQNLVGDSTSDRRRNDAAGGNLNTAANYSNYNQLRSLGGVYHFQQTRVPISDGFYNIYIELNARDRTMFGGDTRIEVETSTVKGKAYSEMASSYQNISGSTIAFGSVMTSDVPGGPRTGGLGDGGENSLVGTGCGGSGVCNFDLIIGFLNKGGKIGGGITHELTILNHQNVALFSGSGSGDRMDGALPSDGNKLANGIATYDQLRTQTVGQYHYSSQRPFDKGGHYTMNMNIDFGARTLGGGNSSLAITGPQAPNTFSGTLNLPSVNYTSLGGNATYAHNGTINGTACGTSCATAFNLEVRNYNGILGGKATHALSVVTQTSGTFTGSGGVQNTERMAGLK
jgi:hypothetical protein